MPELDLGLSDHSVNRCQVLDRLLAVMAWPDHDVWRARAIESSNVAAEIERLENLALRDGTFVIGEPLVRDCAHVDTNLHFLRRAAAALPMATIREESGVRIGNGQRVGMVLLEALRLGRRPVAGGRWRSLNEIKKHYAKMPPPGVKASSIQTMHNIWKQFQPVAHLWASWAMMRMSAASKNHDLAQHDGVVPCLAGEIEEFLAFAEACRVVGEATRFHQSSEFVLREGETWRMPVDLLAALELRVAEFISVVRDAGKENRWERPASPRT